MVYERNPIDKVETLKTLRISPSSINTFFSCPRKWYYQYVLAMEQEQTIDLIKGTIVHKVLEEVFKISRFPSGETFRNSIMTKSFQLLDKYWEEQASPFIMDEEKKKIAYIEARLIIDKYFTKFCDMIQEGIQSNIFESELRGYYYLRPKFKEQWIDDQYKVDDKFKPILINGQKVPIEDTLNVGGFVDSIQKDFSNNIILVDYKTSKKYKESISDEYVRQVSIYAYLYWKQQNKMPSLVAINYLRYGETFYILVTQSLIQRALEDVKNMRNKIVDWELDINKYYCVESKLCDYCVMNKTCTRDCNKLGEHKHEKN